MSNDLLRPTLTVNANKRFGSSFGWGHAEGTMILMWFLFAVMLRYAALDLQGRTPLWIFFMFAGWFALFKAIRLLFSAIMDSFEITQFGRVGAPQEPAKGLKWAFCKYWMIIIFMAVVTVYKTNKPELAAMPLQSFDGIAFDHHSIAHTGWSALTSIFVILLLYSERKDSKVTLQKAIDKFSDHIVAFLAAIVLMVLVHTCLSAVQGPVRQFLITWEYGFGHAWHKVIYLIYMVFFSSLRLFASIVIPVYALTLSIKRSGA